MADSRQSAIGQDKRERVGVSGSQKSLGDKSAINGSTEPKSTEQKSTDQSMKNIDLLQL